MEEKRFYFQPRWKEELVVYFKPNWKDGLIVASEQGTFVLDHPMGILTVSFPTEQEWNHRAPEWARPHWPELRKELEDWCKKCGAKLEIDARAGVYPEMSGKY